VGVDREKLDLLCAAQREKRKGGRPKKAAAVCAEPGPAPAETADLLDGEDADVDPKRLTRWIADVDPKRLTRWISPREKAASCHADGGVMRGGDWLLAECAARAKRGQRVVIQKHPSLNGMAALFLE
jgi:hypothetical protein